MVDRLQSDRRTRHERAQHGHQQPVVQADRNGDPLGSPRQFTSWAFTRRARESGLVPSMGSIGDCYDNAVIESFWGRVQTELLKRRRWRTRIELANALFECLEIFHNRRRRHSALGMLTRSSTRCSTAPNQSPEPQQPDSTEPGVHQSLRTRWGASARACGERLSPAVWWD